MNITVLNTKIGEVGNKMPNTNGLVTTAVLNTKIGEVKNETRVVSELVKEKYYDAKISNVERTYFNTSHYNKFTSEILDAKIKQNLIFQNSDLNTKLKTLTTKTELKADKIKSKVK